MRPPLGPLPLLSLSLLLLLFGAEWAGDRSTCVLALQSAQQRAQCSAVQGKAA